MAAGLALFAAGTALATSDLSGLVSTGSDDVATARGAHQPLGTLSATPQTTPQSDEGAGEILGGGQGGGQGGGEDAEEVEGVAGEDVASSPAAGSGTDDGESLPFTGLLAIPLLGLGAILLMAGSVMRRRVPPPVSS